MFPTQPFQPLFIRYRLYNGCGAWSVQSFLFRIIGPRLQFFLWYFHLVLLHSQCFRYGDVQCDFRYKTMVDELLTLFIYLITVFYKGFVYRCLSFCPFSFDYRIVLSFFDILLLVTLLVTANIYLANKGSPVFSR